MTSIKSLSNAVEINVDGSGKVLYLDFSDKRFANRVLQLIKKWKNVDKELQDRADEIDAIEDEMDRLIAMSELEVDILEKFKDDVNKVFGCDIVEAMFGNILPSVERYSLLFDAVTPFIAESQEREREMLESVSRKYKLGTVKERKDL